MRSETHRLLILDKYTLMFSGCDPKVNTISQQWERALVLDLSKEDWERIHTHIHKGSTNISAQENRFKIYSRWYRTSDRIHKYQPGVSPLCWRCNEAHGSLLYIWWCCPLIQPFGKEVHRLTIQITIYSPDFTPVQYLLHHTSIPQSAYKRSLILHLINAAKFCIPIHWKDNTHPSISEWLQRIEKIADMEDLVHQTRETLKKFQKTWACWLHFTESVEFRNLLNVPQ